MTSWKGFQSRPQTVFWENHGDSSMPKVHSEHENDRNSPLNAGHLVQFCSSPAERHMLIMNTRHHFHMLIMNTRHHFHMLIMNTRHHFHMLIMNTRHHFHMLSVSNREKFTCSGLERNACCDPEHASIWQQWHA